MRRRDLLAGALALGAVSSRAWAQGAPQGDSVAWDLALKHAQDLAASAYGAPVPLPQAFPYFSYDAYRTLRYRSDKALWRDLNLPFQVEMFHRGGMFTRQMELFEVVAGQTRPILYDPALFSFGDKAPGVSDPDLGFAGFRIHAPINAPGRYDEVAAFLGASYFRAVAAGGVYGLSARGLAIGSGDPNEEFPDFRRVYLERPTADATAISFAMVLDSTSLSGAYRFTVTPGTTTRFEVQARLFPRTQIAAVGLAPLTSMYLYGPEQPRHFDDFRPEVHDSDGLLLANGEGKRLWRPLANPRKEQISDFATASGMRFGLMQRQRQFAAYQDLETDYHRRPSAWVTPLLGFDPGAVRLVELASPDETNDNIVAYWRPSGPLAAGQPKDLAYTIDWGADPAADPGLVKAIKWSDGAGAGKGLRLFIIDFGSPQGQGQALDPVSLKAQVTASAGGVQHVTLQANAYDGGVRLSFELDPQGAAVSELRCALVQDDRQVSEEWAYRWLS